MSLENVFISSTTGSTKLSTEYNAKLLQQLKSGFKRKINWNKYQSKVSMQRQNWYLDPFLGRKYTFCFIFSK